MQSKKFVRILSMVLAVTAVCTLYSGCKTSSTAQQVIKYNLGAEPATADPALNNAVDGAIVIVNTFEGLTRINVKV